MMGGVAGGNQRPCVARCAEYVVGDEREGLMVVTTLKDPLVLASRLSTALGSLAALFWLAALALRDTVASSSRQN